MTKLEIILVRQELVAAGLLELATDQNGNPLFRNGQPVWKITEKGKRVVEQQLPITEPDDERN
jgi:hypothetical protein